MSSNAQLPDFLSIEAEFAVLRPKAEMSLKDAVALIGEAIRYCRENNIEGLLLDARELYGFGNPTVVDRYWFAREWAAAAAGEVVLSTIQRPEMIDPEHIGVTIAGNAGLVANVFETENDARAWLAANVPARSGT